MDFEGSDEVLLRRKYFWSTYFWHWNNAPFKICCNLHGNAFYLFFLNKRSSATSLLMIHLKCTVIHYANLNSSSMNKPYLRGCWIYYFVGGFFGFLFMLFIYFNEAFVTNFMKKLSFFNTNFQNSFQDVVYYRILGCQALWYLNGGPLNFDIFFKRLHEESFEDLQINSNWKFQTRTTISHKMAAL